MRPERLRISPPLFFIGLMIVCHLLLRIFVARHLEARGIYASDAQHLASLASALVLFVLLWPVLRQHGQFLAEQLSLASIRPAAVVAAIVIGLLLRLVFWGQVVGLAAYSAMAGTASGPPAALLFLFSCPPMQTLLLGLLVSVVLTPFVEEVTMRGFVLHGLLRRGWLLALVGSSLLFALLHSPSSMPFAFVAGILFALLALRCGSLWPGIIAHATYNAAILLDWVCLQGIWNPAPGDPNMPALAMTSLLVVAVAFFSIATLLKSKWLAPNSHASHPPDSA